MSTQVVQAVDGTSVDSLGETVWYAPHSRRHVPVTVVGLMFGPLFSRYVLCRVEASVPYEGASWNLYDMGEVVPLPVSCLYDETIVG